MSLFKTGAAFSPFPEIFSQVILAGSLKKYCIVKGFKGQPLYLIARKCSPYSILVTPQATNISFVHHRVADLRLVDHRAPLPKIARWPHPVNYTGGFNIGCIYVSD